jgi:nitronate monooxygenase
MPSSELRSPQFPLATNAVAPMRAAAEASATSDFSPLWAGQGAALGREIGAAELTRRLAADAAERLSVLARE